jgi:hypothetical protein
MLLFRHNAFGRVWPQAERLAWPIDCPKGVYKGVYKGLYKGARQVACADKLPK